MKNLIRAATVLASLGIAWSADAACVNRPATPIGQGGAQGSPFVTKNVTRLDAQTSDNVKFTGGCIDGIPIGHNVRDSGKFTTLFIGDAISDASPTPDPTVVIGRTITGSSNAHEITVDSAYNATGSYNPYDCRPDIQQTGSDSSNHIVCFQARPDITGTANVPNVKGFHFQPQFWDTANGDQVIGFHILDPKFNNSSTYRIFKGFNCELVLTAASNGGNHWCFYDEGNLNYFGGFVGFGKNTPTATIEFGGSQGDVVTVKDNSTIYTRTGAGSAWFFQPTTNFPSGTQQYWNIRPVYSATGVSTDPIYVANLGGEIKAGSAAISGELAVVRSGWTVSATTGTFAKLFANHAVDATTAGATLTGQAGYVCDNFAAATNNTCVLGGTTTIPSGNWFLYGASNKANNLVGPLQLGTQTALTMSSGELGFAKMTASGAAPGAAGGKIALVCGTNAGSAKIIAYAGTSTSPTTVLDNIGSGVTGC